MEYEEEEVEVEVVEEEEEEIVEVIPEEEEEAAEVMQVSLFMKQ